MATIDQQFVEFVVKALVSDPDSVSINRTIDEKGVLLELSVAQEDLGRVIGKRGNTAQSIRTLLRALGTKNDARYNLKIVDPEGDARRAERNDRKDEDKKTEETTTAEPAAAAVPTPEPSESASQWAHLSSSNDDSDDEDVDNTTDEPEESSTEAEDDTVEKHKKDLADLDDIGL
ncbi:TPA: KH domain-containing protein [Candidatus Saccharibacteria bacterium]|nr:KH domain-containing protein [Candidatus Saccharibacteria bacterium]HIO87501.1 KH domain-containing protein [Candidatus Saccharibacteria bacterium]